MRDAPVPSQNQHRIVGKPVAKNVRIRKDRAEHHRPGDDAGAIHGLGREQVFAVEDRFADQRAGDSVSDCVHSFCLDKAFPSNGSIFPDTTLRKNHYFRSL
jgi:hypothetical protein